MLCVRTCTYFDEQACAVGHQGHRGAQMAADHRVMQRGPALLVLRVLHGRVRNNVNRLCVAYKDTDTPWVRQRDSHTHAIRTQNTRTIDKQIDGEREKKEKRNEQ